MKTGSRALCTDPYWVGRPDCSHCAVRKSMLFAGLPEADLDHLLRPVDNFRYPPGVTIVRAGESPRAVYTLRRGYLKVQQLQADGKRRLLRLLRAGDAADLESLVDRPYPHDLVTLTEADVCRVPAQTLMGLANKHPELHIAMHERWRRGLEQADRTMLDLLSGEAAQRIARLLCFLDDFAEDGALPRLRRTDMAGLLDLTIETTSRVCRRLIADGLLTESGRQLRIDRRRMEALAAR